MSTKSFYFFLVILLILESGCSKEEYHYPVHNIYVSNHLENTNIVAVMPYCSFPDDVIYDSLILSLESLKPVYFINPHQTSLILSCEYQIYWHCDTLLITFVNRDTVHNYMWEIITRDTLWLSKYELSLSDISLLNDTIPYPPTPVMQKMKMYPPYEEINNKTN